MIKLFSKDASGSIRVWTIDNQEETIKICFGVLNGAMQTKYEIVEQKGGRTLEQQLESRIQSRINAQLDKGYVFSIDDAIENKRTNSAGLLRPMLAKPIKNIKDIDYEGAIYQHKYDGNRCLITKQNGEMIAYSRNGKIIKTIGHIVEGIKLQEGDTIDGELYCHGVPLQTICSWVKREQADTKRIDYRIYDTIRNEKYIDRLRYLKTIETGVNAGLVPYYTIEKEDEIESLLRHSLQYGYEGGILRWGNSVYEDGKRSGSLAKIKVFEDNEFEVVDVISSKDGWARLVLLADNGKEFTVTSPGSMENKIEILECRDAYIGKMVNIKYANLTKDGIPFHPVATGIREEE